MVSSVTVREAVGRTGGSATTVEEGGGDSAAGGSAEQAAVRRRQADRRAAGIRRRIAFTPFSRSTGKIFAPGAPGRQKRRTPLLIYVQCKNSCFSGKCQHLTSRVVSGHGDWMYGAISPNFRQLPGSVGNSDTRRRLSMAGAGKGRYHTTIKELPRQTRARPHKGII